MNYFEELLAEKDARIFHIGALCHAKGTNKFGRSVLAAIQPERPVFDAEVVQLVISTQENHRTVCEDKREQKEAFDAENPDRQDVITVIIRNTLPRSTMYTGTIEGILRMCRIR